jgi:hypothetical protein
MYEKVQYFCSATPETRMDSIGLADVCTYEDRDLLYGFGVFIPVTVKCSVF